MRRNIIPIATAVAVIAVLPASGLAGSIEQAAQAPTPHGVVLRVERLAKALKAFKSRFANARRDINHLMTDVNKAQTDIQALKDKDVAQSSAITSLQADDTTVQGNITTINGQISSINSQLSAGATALTAIQSALQNPTTGLVGLNAARPQFGAFGTNGAIIAGTGQVSGASGPKANATEGAGALADLYVVDFGNDVSARFLTVTQFPTGGASTNRASMAVDCAATTGASTLCGAVQGVASDSSKNHVVVQFGSAGSGAADNSWEVAALSG